MKKVLLLIVVCLSCGILGPLTAGAATSQVTQTINPIQCTYTVFKTGTVTLTPTQCSNQLVPTLSSITTSLQPRLTGTFASADTSTLRVFVGENWFTLGISSALTVNGDAWTLDLANTSYVLAPNTTYTVIIDTTTLDGYQLSSVYEDILTTPAAAPLIANSSNGPNSNSTSPQSLMRATTPIDLIAPFSQSGLSSTAGMPRYYNMSFGGMRNIRIDNGMSSESHSGVHWTIIPIAILTGVAVLIIMTVSRVAYSAWMLRRGR